MTHLEQAIKDAVANGWYDYQDAGTTTLGEVYISGRLEKSYVRLHHLLAVAPIYHQLPLSAALLDPAFWQALSKARGWKNNSLDFGEAAWPAWKLKWHRLIDHLASGKDIESFFTSLV